jgi:hypothetical protein
MQELIACSDKQPEAFARDSFDSAPGERRNAS